MKALISLPVLILVVLLDLISKKVAVALLPPSGEAQQFLGDVMRFAIVYNPGAAFGLYLGGFSRWIFMALTIGALVILWRLYRQTSPSNLWRVLAISLVAAGALGNLIDRLASERGVVDFIDVGFGLHRWPTFNLADVAVSTGAFLLAWVLWGEDHLDEVGTTDRVVAASDASNDVSNAVASEQP
jgi:signal peptidase II